MLVLSSALPLRYRRWASVLDTAGAGAGAGVAVGVGELVSGRTYRSEMLFQVIQRHRTI